jgi:hypothetical protein
LRLSNIKAKESFASKRANDKELTKVDPQLVIPAVTISTRLRAFVLKVPSIKRAQLAIKR